MRRFPPLRLVQARILERDRSVAREHLEQPHVVFVELTDAELRDPDHADHAGAVAERDSDLGLLDRVRAGDHHRVLALERVRDEQRHAGRGHVAGDSVADLRAREVDPLAVARDELAAERDRNHLVALDDRDATVVVIDQEPELVRDHGADLAHVVESVQLAGEALQHLQVGDRADVAAGRGRDLGTLARGLVEEDDLVLAARLRGHHRGLGAGDQLARVHRVLRALRDADRDRDLAGRPELDGRERVGQAAREVDRVAGVAGGDDHAELLAAETADDVGAAHGAAQQVGEVAQHLVAGAVAVDVVDALEVVDVEHQHGDRVAHTAGARQLGAQPLVEVAVVVEAGERVRLRLVLEPRADLRVVECERRRVREANRELELLVLEGGGLAEAVDVEHALDHVARDQRNGDQRLGLVGRSPGHGLRAGIEVRLVRAHRLAMQRGPAGDALAELRAAVHDLLGPLVTREHRDQHGLRLVGLVDREGVVRDELGQRVGDPL